MSEMDLKEMWGKSAEKLAEKPPYDIKAMLSGKSISPLRKLKRNLYIHMAYGVAGVGFFTAIMWFFPYTAVFIGSGIIMAISIFFLGQLSVMARSLERLIKLQPGNLLEALRQQHTLIRSTFSVQEAIAIPFYAVSISLGMYIGFFYDSAPAALNLQLHSWIIYGIVVILWTFLANRLERWMNQKAFGVHLDHMKEIISQLEQEPESTAENSL
ncbi:MAG: hypothetical protein RG741_06715 [Bacteroidales bacterium]|nr:hypothetical protein [Bacteroidales bacterium]